MTSVTLADSTVVTVKTYSSAFPDKPIDQADSDTTTKASSYPIMIINSPNLDWEDFTLCKKWINGTIMLDIFTTKAEAADTFIDAMIESIETYRGTLRDDGLMFVNVDLTEKDEFFRGHIKVHRKAVTFSFRYIFTKTQTY